MATWKDSVETKHLERVFANLTRPVKNMFIGQEHFFVTLRDAYSR